MKADERDVSHFHYTRKILICNFKWVSKSQRKGNFKKRCLKQEKIQKSFFYCSSYANETLRRKNEVVQVRRKIAEDVKKLLWTIGYDNVVEKNELKVGKRKVTKDTMSKEFM